MTGKLSLTQRACTALALLLTTMMPVRAAAQDPVPPPAATPEQIATWQAELDRANAKRSSGSNQVWAGVGMIAGGAALTFVGVGQDARALSIIGLVTLGTGAIVAGTSGRSGRDAAIAADWLRAHGPAPLPRGAWERELRVQQRRHTNGVTTTAIGIGIVAAGAAFKLARHCEDSPYSMYYSSTCHSSSALTGGLALGGVITAVAGANMSRNAARTMDMLKAHPPLGDVPVALRVSDRSSVSFALGPLMSVQWQVRW